MTTGSCIRSEMGGLRTDCFYDVRAGAASVFTFNGQDQLHSMIGYRVSSTTYWLIAYTTDKLLRNYE